MALGDFHLHSHYSDGILSPADLVAKASANHVQVLALTDHDTTEGVPEALAAGEKMGVRVIPGVEISVDLPNGSDAHILGYFKTIDNEKLQHQLTQYREGRHHRGKNIVSALENLGLPLSWDRVLEIAGKAAVGRPHIAQAMVEKQYVTSVRQAFDQFLATGGSADADREKLLPMDALSLIHQAGGISVLAHPSFLHEPPVAIAELANFNLHGLEVYYKNYDDQTIATFNALAKTHGLIQSGGSDFHGIHDDEREPGNIPLPDHIVTAFLDYVSSHWKKTN